VKLLVFARRYQACDVDNSVERRSEVNI